MRPMHPRPSLPQVNGGLGSPSLRPRARSRRATPEPKVTVGRATPVLYARRRGSRTAPAPRGRGETRPGLSFGPTRLRLLRGSGEPSTTRLLARALSCSHLLATTCSNESDGQPTAPSESSCSVINSPGILPPRIIY
jgi:hypothetical protein